MSTSHTFSAFINLLLSTFISNIKYMNIDECIELANMIIFRYCFIGGLDNEHTEFLLFKISHNITNIAEYKKFCHYDIESKYYKMESIDELQHLLITSFPKFILPSLQPLPDRKSVV